MYDNRGDFQNALSYDGCSYENGIQYRSNRLVSISLGPRKHEDVERRDVRIENCPNKLDPNMDEQAIELSGIFYDICALNSPNKCLFCFNEREYWSLRLPLQIDNKNSKQMVELKHVKSFPRKPDAFYTDGHSVFIIGINSLERSDDDDGLTSSCNLGEHQNNHNRKAVIVIYDISSDFWHLVKIFTLKDTIILDLNILGDMVFYLRSCSVDGNNYEMCFFRIQNGPSTENEAKNKSFLLEDETNASWTLDELIKHKTIALDEQSISRQTTPKSSNDSSQSDNQIKKLKLGREKINEVTTQKIKSENVKGDNNSTSSTQNHDDNNNLDDINENAVFSTSSPVLSTVRQYVTGFLRGTDNSNNNMIGEKINTESNAGNTTDTNFLNSSKPVVMFIKSFLLVKRGLVLVFTKYIVTYAIDQRPQCFTFLNDDINICSAAVNIGTGFDYVNGTGIPYIEKLRSGFLVLGTNTGKVIMIDLNMLFREGLIQNNNNNEICDNLLIVQAFSDDETNGEANRLLPITRIEAISYENIAVFHDSYDNNNNNNNNSDTRAFQGVLLEQDLATNFFYTHKFTEDRNEKNSIYYVPQLYAVENNDSFYNPIYVQRIFNDVQSRSRRTPWTILPFKIYQHELSTISLHADNENEILKEQINVLTSIHNKDKVHNEDYDHVVLNDKDDTKRLFNKDDDANKKNLATIGDLIRKQGTSIESRLNTKLSRITKYVDPLQRNIIIQNNIPGQTNSKRFRLDIDDGEDEDGEHNNSSDEKTANILENNHQSIKRTRASLE